MTPSTSPPARHLRVGDRIEKYTVEGVLGEGGVARVYQIRHNTLRTTHALKILTQHQADVRDRLLLEGRVQAQLQHHNIVAVTDVIEMATGVGLVLEYVGGDALDELLAKKRLTIAQVDQLAEGIFLGVGHAHSHGLVHRDLKPANILLHIEGRAVVPKVADFGLVMAEGGVGSFRTGESMGTPRYMSPEQIRDAGSVDKRSDVFALGAILYEMLVGQPAFSPRSSDLLEIFNAIENNRYIAPAALRSGIPTRMRRAIECALSTNPDDRPPDVEALRALWSGEETPANEVSPLVAVMQRHDSLGSALVTSFAPTPAPARAGVPFRRHTPSQPPVSPAAWSVSSVDAAKAIVFGALVGFLVFAVGLAAFLP